MMKSRQSLKNLVRTGLSFSLGFLILSILISGCSSSTKPTFLKEHIEKAVQDICKKEYNISVKTKLVGQTLWIYYPVEDLVIKSDKPEKFTEKFEINDKDARFYDGLLGVKYSIKPIPEKEQTQEVIFNKDILEKINNILKVVRRVMFSTDHSKNDEPRFFYLITADIKNGLELTQIFYDLDLKKISYEFISWDEFQHRSIQDTEVNPEIIGDTEGAHLNYKDITLEDFIAYQIVNRIKLKFQRPEVNKNADIDKEIRKIVAYTLQIYGFKDFSSVELENLLTENKIILNRAAILSKSAEK